MPRSDRASKVLHSAGRQLAGREAEQKDTRVTEMLASRGRGHTSSSLTAEATPATGSLFSEQSGNPGFELDYNQLLSLGLSFSV